MKALREIGLGRAAKFGFYTLAMLPYRVALVPQLRAPWLRLLGAGIGRRSILHDVRFFNLYRRGLSGLSIGDDCFLGDECLLDLADAIRFEDQVTLAERVVILTHTNVGYQDHPLQGHFPATTAPRHDPARLVRGRERDDPAGPDDRPGVVRRAPAASSRRTCRPARVVAGVPAHPLRTLA